MPFSRESENTKVMTLQSFLNSNLQSPVLFKQSSLWKRTDKSQGDPVSSCSDYFSLHPHQLNSNYTVTFALLILEASWGSPDFLCQSGHANNSRQFVFECLLHWPHGLSSKLPSCALCGRFQSPNHFSKLPPQVLMCWLAHYNSSGPFIFETVPAHSAPSPHTLFLPHLLLSLKSLTMWSLLLWPTFANPGNIYFSLLSSAWPELSLLLAISKNPPPVHSVQ